MSRIFITGSADGLGKISAQLLVEQGHQVVLHARNDKRAKDAMVEIPGAEAVVTGDVSSIAQARSVADQVNNLGNFDAVIHNVGVGFKEPKELTEDGIPFVFAVNTLAPYILTGLIKKPRRLIYLSSGMHFSADTSMQDMLWEKRKWQSSAAYSETKFQDVLLAFGVARLWPDVYSNAVEPGWVPTKMGGQNAPDDLMEGNETQVWLATSDDRTALQSGQYFFHKHLRDPLAAARDTAKQDLLLAKCKSLTGISL
jgi:NAD(P)-dependent dehydrogenase (short-subunit alcohol dehydrogenase family)